MIPSDRLQSLIVQEGVGGEGRAIIDGSLVIYDFENPPTWLVPVLALRDEDGNTE